MPDDTDLAPDDGEGLLDHPDDNLSGADLENPPPVEGLPEVDNPDDEPGEQLDTGQDIGKTKPVNEGDSIEFPIDAPAAAVDDLGPTPITPASSTEQYEARVHYENAVNGQFEAWIETNKAAILETFLAGGTVELQHNTADSGEDDDEAPGSLGDKSSTIPTPKS